MSDEKILWSGEPKGIIVLYWALNKFIGFLILIGVVLFLYTAYSTRPGLHSLFLYISIIIGFYLIIILYSFFLRKTYKYSISSQTVNFEGGILNRQFRNIPYHKITDVTKSQTILQRIFQIYDLHIQTAGTSFAEISFVGLDDPDLPKGLIMKNVNKLQNQST